MIAIGWLLILVYTGIVMYCLYYTESTYDFFIGNHRRRKYPPCSQCKWNDSNDKAWCKNPKGVDLMQRELGSSGLYSYKTAQYRGSRYCNFEARDDDE